MNMGYEFSYIDYFAGAMDSKLPNSARLMVAVTSFRAIKAAPVFPGQWSPNCHPARCCRLANW